MLARASWPMGWESPDSQPALSPSTAGLGLVMIARRGSARSWPACTHMDKAEAETLLGQKIGRPISGWVSLCGTSPYPSESGWTRPVALPSQGLLVRKPSVQHQTRSLWFLQLYLGFRFRNPSEALPELMVLRAPGIGHTSALIGISPHGADWCCFTLAVMTNLERAWELWSSWPAGPRVPSSFLSPRVPPLWNGDKLSLETALSHAPGLSGALLGCWSAGGLRVPAVSCVWPPPHRAGSRVTSPGMQCLRALLACVLREPLGSLCDLPPRGPSYPL